MANDEIAASARITSGLALANAPSLRAQSAQKRARLKSRQPPARQALHIPHKNCFDTSWETPSFKGRRLYSIR